MELLVAPGGHPGGHRKRVARLREGVAREDGHRRAHPASLPRHVGPEHGPVDDVEGNPHHLLVDIEDAFRGVDFLPAGEYLPPGGYHLVGHRRYPSAVEHRLQHATPGLPGVVISVGEKSFAEYQPQPDLLVGSFLDLEKCFLLLDQHFLGKVGMGYQVHCTWPDPEPDNVTILRPGLLHRADQAIAAEVP